MAADTVGGVPHVDSAECVLVVIDAQDGFYPASRADVDRGRLHAALDRIGWVVGVATALGIPVVVTEEDPATNGPTAPAITRFLPVDAVRHEKVVFGAPDNPGIAAAVATTGRPTVVLVGMETDVCVAHSAMGWRDLGHRVVVIGDAVYSAGEAHAFGLARLRQEGIELLSAKEAYYEWLRTLPAVRAFDTAHPGLATPPGFSL